jgi:hypothetical protein
MPAPATYSTVDEILALYDIPQKKAEQLLAQSQIVIDHGRTEPEGVAEMDDRRDWVERGYNHLVSTERAR